MARAERPGSLRMRIGTFAAGCLAAGPVMGEMRTEPLPLWEVGAGLAATRLPDYRGADESRNYLLPFPYFVYRGEFLRADREGLRAKFLDSPYVELDFSVGATVPVRSEKNRARAGMPDLRPTVEIGPLLKIHLAHVGEAEPGRRDFELDLRVPVRRAFTWRDGGPRDIGTLVFPHLNLDRRVRFAGARWNLGLLAGGYFSDGRYHRYFYSVAPEYATPERPAYPARGGFGGWQAIVAMSATYGQTWIGGFFKGDWLRGATFEDSPLVRRRTNVSFGLGVSHIFARSATRVERTQ